MDQFFCKTRIISGAGASKALETLHIKRLLLVADPFFAQNGTAGRVAALAKAEATELFDRVQPDPTVQLAAEGAAVVQRFNPDAIVALGGGSAMDCAKAMAYFSGLKPQLVAIPTTSGSGSEVTDFAILTHDGVKHPLVDDTLRPHVAILDDDLLKEIPKSLIAAGGFDLICHGLEAWVATGAGAFSNALAAEAFCTAWQLLPKSFHGDTAARLPLHNAATMAGMAFSAAGLGLCHALAHSLGGEFHIPHGRLNAILLPLVVDFNASSCSAAYAGLARRAGLSTGTDPIALRALKNGLVRLRRSLDLPENLTQAGVSAADVRRNMDGLVAAALADPCCATNPVRADETAVRRILSEAIGHG